MGYCAVRVKNPPSAFVTLTYVGKLVEEHKDSIVLKNPYRLAEMAFQGQDQNGMATYSFKTSVLNDDTLGGSEHVEIRDIGLVSKIDEKEQKHIFDAIKSFEDSQRLQKAGLVAAPARPISQIPSSTNPSARRGR